MPGLGFPRVEPLAKQQQRSRRSCNLRRRRRGGGNREVESPNSIILFSSNNTATNSFLVSSSSSLFSSSSATGSAVDRCSFGSDHDGLLSQLSLHLAGRDRGCKGPDPEKRPSCDITIPHKFKDKAVPEVVGYEDEGEEEEEEEEEETLDPAKHSFSLALRECQNRRFGSEALLPSLAEIKNRRRRRRPASLDLNSQGSDASLSSPRLFVARGSMKNMSSRGRSGTFPSPRTPNYKHGEGPVVCNKGWSSERVPLPVNYSRRYGSSAALFLPFNNGRTLPSKWEDAEKWIFSPVSGDGGIGRPLVPPPPHHRRPKSKSGPIGAPMGASGPYSAASPPVPVFDGGRVRNFTVSSPFHLLADRGACGEEEEGRGGGRSASANGDPCIVRSASVHGELMIESSSSLSISHDEKLDITRDAATMISPVAVRKDMATQMSPECSTHSSPKERPYYSPSPPSIHTIGELQTHLCKLEVRDVQVDDRVTVTRWSKKHIARGMDKGLGNIIEWKKKKTVEAKSCAWEVSETAKCISKFTREEAKITAWENLQKAKAEAAMRKLEDLKQSDGSLHRKEMLVCSKEYKEDSDADMRNLADLVVLLARAIGKPVRREGMNSNRMKLEKKRSSSIKKIMNKLRSAQRKAREMRNGVNASQGHQVTRTPQKVLSLRRTAQIGSLSGCFTCHAF